MENTMLKLAKRSHALDILASKQVTRVTWARRITIFYNRRMAVNPYATTMLTGAVIVPFGDFICQTATRGDKRYDWWRTAGMLSFGLLYIGVFNAWLYRRYARWFSRVKNPVANLACRVFADTFIHVPLIWLPTFYFWTGTIKGESTEYISQKLQESYLMALLGSWAIWIPATSTNFHFVPPQMRILFMCTVSLIDKIRLSYMSNRSLVKGVAQIAKN